MDQLVELNESMEEIRRLGYSLYAVSADTPESHTALIQSRDFGFEMLSDPETAFYKRAGIVAGDDGSIQRGVVIYSPDERVLFRKITPDPASVLLEQL